jgi:hypothetical protein
MAFGPVVLYATDWSPRSASEPTAVLRKDRSAMNPTTKTAVGEPDAVPPAAATARPSAAEFFAVELAAYRRELPRLLEEGYAWRYALFKGDTLLNVWDTFRDGLQAGTERFGIELFFLKKIDPRDPERFAQLDAQEGRR